MTEVAALGLRVDGVADIDRASSSLDRFTKSSKSADQASGSLSTESRNTSKSLADVAREGDRSSASITKLAGAAKLAAGAFAGIKLTGLIKDVTTANSRFEQLGVVMEVVGRNAGLSQSQVARYAKEVENMGISMTESRQTVIRMIQAQMDLTKAAELARLAQDAAVIANTNSSDALGRLIIGLQSGQVEILRNMGLNVNFAASYSKLAAEMGVTVDQLSEVDKVQARTNAVMEAGSQIAGSYAASMGNAGKQLGSTTRHVENLQVALGAVWQGEFSGGVEAYSSALKVLGENADTVAQVLKTGVYAAAGLAAGALAKKTAATVSAMLAARAQAAEELRLANAHVAATAQALAHATANNTLTGATGRLTAATVAHEAALKRQAAAQAAAAGIGRTLLGVMGGPAGLAITAGAVALSFVNWGRSAEEAARESIALREETNLLTRAVKELDAAQAQQVLQKMEEPYKAAQDEARKYAAQIEYLTMQLDRHPGSAKVDEWNRSLVDARGNLSTVNEAIAEQEEKMRRLNERINENTQAREENNNVLGETDEVGKRWLASLQQRADFSGELTEVQRVSIAIEKGYAGALSETDKALALANAAIIDRNNAVKSSIKSTKDLDTAFQSLMDTLFPAEAAQRKYNEQIALLKKHLSGDRLAKAIDRLNDSLADGDHTGPADAIAAYVEELQNLEDKINPAGRAAREFAEEQAKLRAEIERSGDPTGKWTRLLEENERQMRENTRVTNQWTEWTESALERVDSAFANAWRNIGDGFSSFRDNLVNAFKQMLAELAHLAITRPIVLQIGAAMGIGGAAAQLSSMGGGGFDLIGMLGRGVSLSQSGFGQAVISGWKSGEGVLGGLQGAFGGGTGYLSGLLGGGGAAGAGTGSTIAGYTGPEFANWVAQQNMAAQTWGGAATSMGAILGGLGGAYMGWQQNGLKGAVGTGLASWGGGALGGMGGAALGQAIGGTIGSVLPGIGTAIGAALGGLLGGSLFGGSGERFKRTVGSATGSYADGQYTSGGQSRTWFAGYHRTFGDEFNQTLDDLNRSFSATLGGLFDAFDIDSTIETETRARQRRTSGRLAADFLVTIDGEMAKHLRQYGGKGDVAKAMEKFADDIMGEYLAKTIVNSALPEYLRDQFRGLTEADQVAETLAGVIARFDGVNSALELVGLTSLSTTDAGLRAADAIVALSGGIESLTGSVSVYYDQFFTAAEKQADTISAVEKAFEAANITLAESREGYRAMVEDIDVTTEAGQQMFATMMSLSGMAAEYYSILEQRAAEAASRLLANASLYYEQFTSESQKTEDALAGVVAQFAELELALPSTRAGFIAAVDALDTSTEAGQRMFETLMSVAGAADAYYDVLEQRASQAVTAAYSLLERSINAEKAALTEAYQQRKAQYEAELQARRQSQQQAAQARSASYRDMAQTAAATASALSRLGGSISSALSGLLDDVPGMLEQRRSSAVAQIRRALETGSLSDADALAEAAQRAAAVDSGVFATLEDYRREQGRTASLLGDLGDLTAARQTAAERQAESLQALAEQSAATAQALGQSISGVRTSIDAAYEAEMAALDEQLELAKSQIDALNGIDNSVVSVADAVEGLSAAIRDAMSIIPGLASIEIPAFASGGVHTGGLRLVGENGPELEVTGPSRIYSAGQTARMLGGAETAAAIRRLEQTVARQGDALRAIAKHTMKSARSTEVLERWDYDGLPEERALA